MPLIKSIKKIKTLVAYIVLTNRHYCIKFNDCFPCKACHKERAKLTVFPQETVTSCISSHVWGHEIIIGKKIICFTRQWAQYHSIIRRNSWAYYLMSSFLVCVTGLRQPAYFNAYSIKRTFQQRVIGKYTYIYSNILPSKNMFILERKSVPFHKNSFSINTTELMSMFGSINDSSMICSA